MRTVVVALALFSFGCSNATPCADVPAQTVVISAWRHMPPDGSNRLAGVNLDHAVGSGLGGSCTDAMDFVSPVSGATGIDNQFGGLVLPLLEGMLGPSGLAAAVLEQNLRGELVLGIELNDAPNVVLLSPVGVLGTDPGGTEIFGGQEFVVVRRFGALPVCLADGQIGLLLSSLDVPMGALGTFELTDVRIRLLIEDGVIAEGELGATLTVPALLDALERVGISGLDESTLRAVSQPDVLPVSFDVCDGISFGVALSLAPAVIS